MSDLKGNLAGQVAERLADAEKRLCAEYGLRRSGYGLRRSSKESGLLLIPLALLDRLPEGLILTSIDGEKYTVGQDEIDDDTRFGLLAYGVVSGQYLPLLEALRKTAVDNR